jgi:uncharacterized membrane protein YebE (DUF533 family)
MKNLIKAATLVSLLIVAALLIASCGTEQAARNKGDVAITVKDNAGLAVAGVLVQVRATQGTGTYTTVGNTSTAGTLTYSDGTAGTTYYFTVSKTGYTTQTDLPATPLLTSTTTLNVTLLP